MPCKEVFAYHLRRRLLDDFLTRGEHLPPKEWLAASYVTTMNLLLTSEQLAALNCELNDVAERYKERYRGQTGTDVRPVMSNPRIRHLVQPPMSVVDRNFGTTNEVRIMMTSTALPIQSAYSNTGRGLLELLISRLAVGMLRWSQQSAERRFAALERSVLARRIEHDGSPAAEYSRLVRHMRLG